MPARTLLISLVLVALGSSVLWTATDGLRALTSEAARRERVATTRPLVPDLLLEDMTGRPLPLRPAAGELVLAEFIYTRCPTVCRVAGDAFAGLRDRLAAAGLGDRVRLVSITFDPQNDGPAELAAYAGRHDARGEIWTAARPTTADLPHLIERFGILIIADPWGGYEHNAAIHLIDGEGRLSALFDIDDIEGTVASLQDRL